MVRLSQLAGRIAPLLPALIALAGCQRQPSFTRTPAGEEANLAGIARATPATAPPRTGGFLDPPRVGKEVRAQSVRPPTPGQRQPPPAGS